MRKILKILLVLVGFAVIGYFAFGIEDRVIEDRTGQNVLPQTIQASLLIGNSSYQVSLTKGASAYDLMKTVALAHSDFMFQGKDFGKGMGFFVSEINGIKESPKDGMYWIYYINNKEARVGVSTYIIKPNDVITWKYEKNSN